MDYFKGKQFQKDVIIVAVGYYLRYNLSYRVVQNSCMIEELMFLTPRFIAGYKSIVKSFIICRRRKIDSPSIRGKWMKPTSKLKDVGTLAKLKGDADGLTLDIWLRKKRNTQAAYAFLKRLHNQFGEP